MKRRIVTVTIFALVLISATVCHAESIVELSPHVTLCQNAVNGVFIEKDGQTLVIYGDPGGEAAGIRIRGETNELVFKNNIIRDTRTNGSQTQTVGIHIEEKVGKIILEGNKIEAKTRIDDKRQSKPK
jgi:hypothetical protein